MGLSGIEVLMKNAIEKALQNPELKQMLQGFLATVEDVKQRQTRVEDKLDRILGLLESQTDPNKTNDVLDSIAVTGLSFPDHRSGPTQIAVFDGGTSQT